MSRPQPDTLRTVVSAVLAGTLPLRAVPPVRLREWAASEFRLRGILVSPGWLGWLPGPSRRVMEPYSEQQADDSSAE